MPVDDLWFLRQRDLTTGERVRSQRYGRGKRWRVRWVDPQTGEPRTEAFERKADAERHDVNMHADISRGQYVDPRAGRVTVAEYAERWRMAQLHRDSTADLVERAIRLYVVPTLGHRAMADVRAQHLRTWVKTVSADLRPSTVHLVYGYLKTMFGAAVVDRVIGVTPCVGVRLPDIPHREATSRPRMRCMRSPRRSRPATNRSPTWPPGAGSAGVRSSAWSWVMSTSRVGRCTSAAS